MTFLSDLFSKTKDDKRPLGAPISPADDPSRAPASSSGSALDDLQRIQLDAEEQIRRIEEVKQREAHDAQEQLRIESQARMHELEEAKHRETETEEQRIRQSSEAKIHELEEQKIREAHEAQERLTQETEARMRELEEAKRREAETEEAAIRERARAKIREIEAARRRVEEEARRVQEDVMRKTIEAEIRRKAFEEARRLSEELAQKKSKETPPPSVDHSDVKEDKAVLEPSVKVPDPAAPASAAQAVSAISRAQAAPLFLEKVQRIAKAGDLMAAQEKREKDKTAAQKEHESTGATSFLDRLKKIRDVGRQEPEKKRKEEPLPAGSLDLLNIDLYRTPTEIIVFAQLPGVDMEDLMVFAEKENDVIVIRAKQKRPEGFADFSKASGGKFIQEECAWGSLYRQITLPEEVDILESWAKLDKGVLILKLPLLRVRKSSDEKKQIKIIEGE
jgi:HSP20 family molecular chaperone IbpA